MLANRYFGTAVEIETLTNKYKNGNKNIWRVDYQR